MLEEILKDRQKRIQYFEYDFNAFALYHFHVDYKYPLSATHVSYMCSLRGPNNVFMCGHREFGKTVIAKHYLIRCIVYKKYRNIMVYTYEIGNARNTLLDVINKLEGSQSIIDDYGSLYTSTRVKGKSEKKTVLEFITNNQVRVKAMSIGKSPRGDVFGASDGQHRPDLILLDDIDVTKSVQNELIIEYNFKWLLSEVFGGLSQEGYKIVFLGNVINEDGVVPRIYAQYPNRERYRVPIIDDDGVIAWPQRYTRQRIQEIEDEMGDVSFQQNFMLKPYSGNGIVKRGWIKYTDPNNQFDYISIGVDPASSTKKLSDSFGIVVAGHTKDEIIILEVVELKESEKEMDNAIGVVVGLYHKWKANIVNIEANNAYIYIADKLKEQHLAVNELHAHNDKVTRLLEHETDLKKAVIKFSNDSDSVGTLIHQLLLFPNGKHDDLVDAMVYAVKKGNSYFFDIV